jgi:peptidoglycan/xylan/chitin deacetylase (PgdA/CDA1 family)
MLMKSFFFILILLLCYTILPFFVLGSRAEKYPELILRMQREGHLIGLHNYVHRPNWMMSPWKIRRDLKRSSDIVKGITGERPIYYRPPWGLLNCLDYFFLKDYKIVLWSLMAEDWRSAGGSKRVKKVLLTKIKQGDIILLHDSGETFGADENAPRNTIEALKDILKEVKIRHLNCSRIDQLL